MRRLLSLPVCRTLAWTMVPCAEEALVQDRRSREPGCRRDPSRRVHRAVAFAQAAAAVRSAELARAHASRVGGVRAWWLMPGSRRARSGRRSESPLEWLTRCTAGLVQLRRSEMRRCCGVRGRARASRRSRSTGPQGASPYTPDEGQLRWRTTELGVALAAAQRRAGRERKAQLPPALSSARVGTANA